MPRIRRFDGSKIYNESWDGPCRDVFFYLIGVASDNYGLLKEEPAAWAGTLHMSPSKVRERIDYLVGQEVFYRYSDGEQGYLASKKWQDYQKVKYPGFPACPVPPPNILGKLSPKTQELFLTFAGSLPEDGGNDSAASRARAAVSFLEGSFLEGSTDGSASVGNPVEQAKNYYLERLGKHTGMEEPEFPHARASGFFSRRVGKGDTFGDFKGTIDYFFDEYIKGDKSAARFGHYQDVYNHLASVVLKRAKDKRKAGADAGKA